MNCVGIYGNCQAASYAIAFESLLRDPIVYVTPAKDSIDLLIHCDHIFVQTAYAAHFQQYDALRRLPASKISFIPTFYFSGLFPDCIIEPQKDGRNLVSGWGIYNSSIVLNAFLRGWSVDDTIRAFSPRTFEALNFLEYWNADRAYFIEDVNQCGVDGEALFNRFLAKSKGAWTVNQPKMALVLESTRQILMSKGVEIRSDSGVAVHDPLAIHGEWPLYPGIAPDVAAPHDFEFLYGPPIAGTMTKTAISLDEFVKASFFAYEAAGATDIVSDRLTAYADVYGSLNPVPKPPAKAHRKHVYSDLPDTSYWLKSVAEPAVEDVDPVVKTKFVLRDTDAIATAGSCFAQHIAKTLLKAGNNFLVTEQAPDGMSPEEALRNNFGTFSARYGNLYTARQLLQLIRRARGEYAPADTAWQRADGRYVDPFRPQIDPDGFSSPEAVEAAAAAHLLAVRDLFARMDVFIFTLGLTESWEAIGDGAVFPVAPGVIAGEMDTAKYRFHNFTIDEVRSDLAAALDLLLRINPKLRVILTVSPVPLVATYENCHVLVSTIYSKSVLRTAADEIARSNDNIDYFPSYEIVSSNYNGGAFFEADKRSVKQEAVDHVMSIFRRHFLGEASQKRSLVDSIASRQKSQAAILCDEELLEKFEEVAGATGGMDPALFGGLVVLGQDGWSFLGNGHQREIDQVLDASAVPPGHVESWVRTLGHMQRHAGRRGAILALAVAPSKASIYPEKLPGVLPSARHSVFDAVLAAAEAVGVRLIDLRGDLIAAKSAVQPYSPLDSHWTDYGAAIAWQRIAADLAIARPGFNFRSVGRVVGHRQTTRHGEFATDADARNPWTQPILENALPEYDLVTATKKYRLDGARWIELFEYPATAWSTAPASDLKCLFLSDSTGSALTPYVTAAFREINFQRHHVTVEETGFNLPAKIRDHKPDVIFLVLTERYLSFPIGNADQWEAADAFDSAGSTTSRTWTGANGFADGPKLNGSPYLEEPGYFNALPATGEDRHVRITLDAEGPGSLTFAFTKDGKVDAKSIEVARADYELYFSLPARVDGEHFWLSRTGAACVIRELEIR